MREYYPVQINLNQAIYYMIWYTDEEDGFITEFSKPLLFPDFDELKQYAKNSGLQLEKDLTSYDFEAVTKWVENPEVKFECELFLDCWNFFNDLSKSVGRPFKGNFDTGNTVDVYNKLFYGSNLPAIRKDGEKYIPGWDEKELLRLKTIMEDGLSILVPFIK